MHVTLGRKPLFVLLGSLALIVGILLNACQPSEAPAQPAPPAAKADKTADLMRLAREVATAFGRGRLYQSPKEYPLTPALQTSIAKLPNRAQAWPEFVGLTGEAVIVLRGFDGDRRPFTDVVIHAVNRGGQQSLQLTQIDLRLIQSDGAWHVDRVLTLPQGAIQPE